MIKVGITGGIGSGKTTIAKIFISLGIPVFFADLVAAKIVSQNKTVLKKIKNAFGNSIDINGRLDRKRLAELVFNDPKKIAKLNAIVHPEVHKNFLSWIKKNNNAPYIIQEAAILIETGGYKKMDYNILITAPEELRIRRILSRENISLHNINLRIKNQWKDKKKIEYCDAIIENDNKKMVLPVVLKLHKKFLAA